MTGVNLAQEVAARQPDIKVIYMSGYTENTVLDQGILDEEVRLISKPFSKDELARAVRTALESGSASR